MKFYMEIVNAEVEVINVEDEGILVQALTEPSQKSCFIPGNMFRILNNAVTTRLKPLDEEAFKLFLKY